MFSTSSCLLYRDIVNIFDKKKISSVGELSLYIADNLMLRTYFMKTRSSVGELCLYIADNLMLRTYFMKTRSSVGDIETEFPNRRSGLHKICSQCQVVCSIEI
jgi:hypothetical protein